MIYLVYTCLSLLGLFLTFVAWEASLDKWRDHQILRDQRKVDRTLLSGDFHRRKEDDNDA